MVDLKSPLPFIYTFTIFHSSFSPRNQFMDCKSLWPYIWNIVNCFLSLQKKEILFQLMLMQRWMAMKNKFRAINLKNEIPTSFLNFWRHEVALLEDYIFSFNYCREFSMMFIIEDNSVIRNGLLENTWPDLTNYNEL